MRVLITAGATWIKIDDIRIIANRFTGKTGLFLAEKFMQKNHSVTLLANPHCLNIEKKKNIITYCYFNEFDKQITKLLKRKRFDVIIHMAAVSDYRLKKPKSGKIASGKKAIKLELVPTEKIIRKIRRLAPNSLLIQFKLEAYRRGLVDEAYRSLVHNKSSFVVANALQDLKTGYKGFLIDRDRNVIPVNSRAALARLLERVVSESQF
jgi:phosphopantothenoylcysteine synthetase/decarboxylase